MKKVLLAFLVLILLIGTAFPVLADAGPKPQLVIKAVNMPDSKCYMDLLVDSEYEGFGDEELLTDEYDQNMVAILVNYDDNGWRPGVVNDLFMTFDDIKCNVSDGECTKVFGYMPPDEFRIIVVDESGRIVVSNTVERTMFVSTVDFDYATGIASERSMFPGILLQFLITLAITLGVEVLLFVIFRFSLRKYWLLVLLVNIGTQVLLHAAIGFGMLIGGMFIAMVFLILAEFAVLFIETITYGFLLKEHKAGRRIAYAITANIASAMIGFTLAMVFA